ncbi:hypothetical protein EV659_103229 [Rhodothalassium salexigens DSM 2132]|uniref:Uncharacterized protein n=1 Tax=Rhodothalassium salexigens DSM 2132 TaxID=1188247 RepID=A0A4R2PL60_RHOSA|nr:hypothetical protein [Rhodothalassium salexigens]MBB4211003.1 hypothetical protein [Rhodothalassium salexigens DSM 2132]MBK1639715.1 hypothetical protein [Rhodothalassium salexigens DSM 2132]TCP36339.1 hypothetical protein EV659_103229 [Rhodothalassium salexigens DSM 2132]
MDRTTLAIYIQELNSQCGFTRAALEVYNQSGRQEAQVGVLFAAQAAVTAASQVASILWPSRARSRRRGEVLREALGLPEKHPLGDRRFAELWDNADEKMDRWVDTHRHGQAVFDAITPLEKLTAAGVTEDDLFRALDPKTGRFYFRGQGYDLNALSRSIADVADRVARLAQQLDLEARAAQQQAAQQADEDDAQDDAAGGATGGSQGA